MLVQDFIGQKVYRAPAPGTRTTKDGTPRDPKRLGKMHRAVFSPNGTHLVGFMVSPPEILGMVKPSDRFVAYDALGVYEGALTVKDEKASFDQAAAKRLGVDLDRCLILVGMDVRCVSGESLGYCTDVAFDPKARAVDYLAVTRGAASSALLGNVRIPAPYLKGYREGCLVVADAARDLDASGGAAAKAAEASVIVGAKVKQGAKALDDHGSVALEKGTRALGRQLGRTKGMFSAFKDEFKRASGTGTTRPTRKD